MDLTDEQWAIIRLLIPDFPKRSDEAKGSRYGEVLEILNGILWILRTGATTTTWYDDMPKRYPPSFQTSCHQHHRFSQGFVLVLLKRSFKHYWLQRFIM